MLIKSKLEERADRIKASVRAKELHLSTHDDASLRDFIDERIMELSKEEVIVLNERLTLSRSVFNHFRALDVIQPLIDDPEITEIMVNGPDRIFIEQKGRVTLTPLRFESREKLDQILQTIVSKVNRQVTERNPIVDARLENGSRVSVVLRPIALDGPILTIRKFSKEPMTLERLIQYGSLDIEVAELLKTLVRAKYNIFISGGTGSGKTSFLNALSGCIPSDERVILIEDSAELQISTIDNLIRLETRDANVEDVGEISIRQLIKASLRMRPDRIIVGEVRGAEALDMLQAMNTGHEGSISTGHANTPLDMLSRLETMVLSGVDMPLEAIRLQISAAIDIVVHLGRMRDKSRKVLEVSEVLPLSGGIYQLNPLFRFVEITDSHEDGAVIGGLKATGQTLIQRTKLKHAGLELKC